MPDTVNPEDKIAQAQAVTQAAMKALETGDLRGATSAILKHAVKITGSEYGFFSVAMDGPFERLLNMEGFRWNETVNREFYENAMKSYANSGHLDFLNVANLAGRAITHNEVVVSNAPATDSRAGGIPAGHPPLECFLGTPLRKDGQLAAVIGLANRPGGYTAAQQADVELLTEAACAASDYYHGARRAQAASIGGSES